MNDREATEALPALLTTAQLAKHVLNLSERRTQDVLKLPWTPRAIVLGQRLVRHSLAEWLHAIASMPRDDRPAEPAQLARSRALRSPTECV